MDGCPFDLEPSPERGGDEGFPLLLKDAFQVWECTLDGSFHDAPERSTDADNTERFLCLRIDDILLRDNFADMLEREDDFPRMAISYGFRHHTGERRFFFCEHKEPFAVPVPTDIGPEWQHIFYEANRIDPDVQFSEEACEPLTAIPAPFLRMALKGIVKQAKEDGVTSVDADYVAALDAKRRGQS